MRYKRQVDSLFGTVTSEPSRFFNNTPSAAQLLVSTPDPTSNEVSASGQVTETVLSNFSVSNVNAPESITTETVPGARLTSQKPFIGVTEDHNEADPNTENQTRAALDSNQSLSLSTVFEDDDNVDVTSQGFDRLDATTDLLTTKDSDRQTAAVDTFMVTTQSDETLVATTQTDEALVATTQSDETLVVTTQMDEMLVATTQSDDTLKVTRKSDNTVLRDSSQYDAPITAADSTMRSSALTALNMTSEATASSLTMDEGVSGDDIVTSPSPAGTSLMMF